MKRLFIIPLVAIFAAQGFAQVNAGDPTDLAYTPLDIDLQMLTNPVNNFTTLLDSVDIDGDEIDDIIIEATLANIPDFGGANTNIRILNPNLEVASDSIFAQRYTSDEVIDQYAIWLDYTTWGVAYDFFGLAGHTTGGHWFPSANDYFGFRLFTPDGYRYGWFHLAVQVSPNSVQMQSTGFAIEDIVDSQKEVAEASWDIYPNPTNGMLFFPDQGIRSAHVYDVYGRVLLESTAQGMRELDVSHLPAGQFFLLLETANGQVNSHRFIRM